MGLLPDIGGAQDADALRVSRHDAVFDAVMDHLDEVAGAVRPAMQVTVLGSAADVLTARSGRYIASARSQRGKQRVEMPDNLCFAADHHAVAAFQPPYSAARPDIDIMDPPRRQLLGTPDIVDVVGIAAVDQDVARFEGRQDVRSEERRVGKECRCWRGPWD